MKTMLATICVGLASQAAAQDAPSVALYVNGTLGDRSFFDSAQRGMDRLASELGMEVHTVEGTYDPTRWEAGLTDLADSGEYDIIITGTYTMAPLVETVSQDYPDVNFIFFDGVVDYAACGCENVHSITFKQNEGSYLAGALAAELTASGAEGTNPEAVLGFLGGMEIPVITDFLVGYTAGAQSVTPDLTVLSQYANNFSDPATGKEMGLAQYGQGADIVFAVAGGTGQGVIEAAAEQGRLVIGVDSDQAALLAESSPQLSERIVTSVLKNVDNAIVDALTRYQAGEAIFGQAQSQGLATGGVGLAINDVTRRYVPEESLARIEALGQQIIDGTIVVPSAF